MTDTVERSLRRLGITVSRLMLGVIATSLAYYSLFFHIRLALILIDAFLIIEGILLLVDYLELRSQNDGNLPLTFVCVLLESTCNSLVGLAKTLQIWDIWKKRTADNSKCLSSKRLHSYTAIV